MQTDNIITILAKDKLAENITNLKYCKMRLEAVVEKETNNIERLEKEIAELEEYLK